MKKLHIQPHLKLAMVLAYLRFVCANSDVTFEGEVVSLHEFINSNNTSERKLNFKIRIVKEEAIDKFLTSVSWMYVMNDFCDNS